MKKLLLAITLLFATSVHADPSLVLKVGAFYGGDDALYGEPSTGFIYALESSTCGNHCISPYFVHLNNGYGKNNGVGIDYIFKPFSRDKDSLRLAFGLVGFDKKLNSDNGEHANFHFGAGFEVYLDKDIGVMLSIDHFSNGMNQLDRVGVKENVPSNMISLGIHFR